MNPYPSWLNAGDNSWQMTAATLVGLMSIPALAVLYGGLVIQLLPELIEISDLQIGSQSH